jgi:streptogramin lyase
MARVSILPHALTTVSTTTVVPLGTVFQDTDGRLYAYVYNFGADSFAVGDVVSIAATFTFGHVSNTAATVADYTDGTTIRPIIGGIALSVVATTQRGWVWFGGTGTHAITTDGNVAANDLLTVTDGAKIATREVTAATAHRSPIGVAHAADSSTTLSSATLKGDGIFPWG